MTVHNNRVSPELRLTRRTTAPRRLAALLSATAVFLAGVLTTPSRAQQPRISGSDDGLGKQIEKLLGHPDVRQTHWGIAVVSMKDKKVLVSTNAEKLFVPASAAKLFPAAAAFSLLGPAFKYRTSLYAEGVTSSGDGRVTLSHSPSDSNRENGSELPGDLVLVGRGDPNLSGRVLPFATQTQRELGPIRAFQELAGTLAAKGIRSVAGNLIADDTYFVHQPHGQGWEHDDLMWLAGAPVSALAINDNTQFVSVFPDVPGGPAAVHVQPLSGYYELDNQAKTVRRTEPVPGGGVRRTRRNLGLHREPGSMRLKLWGEIPEGAVESSYAVAIEDPPRFAAEYLRQELANLGVEIRGQIVVRRRDVLEAEERVGSPLIPPLGPPLVSPLASTLPSPLMAAQAAQSPGSAAPLLLAEHESAPLAESLAVVLKVSQNLHAEMLLRTLGRERRGVGSAEAGLAAIEEFLTARGIASDGVVLRDGSGLSRQNMVSPQAMTALLGHMYQSEQGAAWTALLPVAGVDGTLRTRLRGRYTTGRVWAKTGSLLGVATMAGYVANQDNDLLAFAIFANNYRGDEDEGSVISIIDQIVTALARSH